MGGGSTTTVTSPEGRRHLSTLFEEASKCTRCPTMHGEPRAFSDANGSEDARCLVVAEAPGRFGAAETGVPLHGDRTGDAFDKLLDAAGIRRAQLFITNAVLCSPRREDGRGRKPSKAEIGECSHYLRTLVEHLDPAIVVTLGSTALNALEEIDSHGLTLRWDVGEVHRWHGRFVLPLYHPGARAMILRPWADQLRDYRLLASLLSA